MANINPYDLNTIQGIFTTFGQNVMPWGIEWAIPIILLIAWAYTAIRGGFEKSLPVGFALFLMGTVAQYYLVGVGEPLGFLTLMTLGFTLIWIRFLAKL